MNLPKVIAELVTSQNEFDSAAYADLFAENAQVSDEGKKHDGKAEIEKWIDKSKTDYKATMEPLNYDEKEDILSAKIAGSFPGSPLILKFHFKIADGKIQNLKVTG
ncbi:nuclear transport factor 2 family protein [Chryseobacterium wangxinyae]|uniref:nuclear transport factor 2 family protein n=1 Tax=Chryseobacterium sp. CY350 TaxID=2997336 RepID=UPI00226F18B2|nr:nuclear transport factor 2 family protein [Chryseobacterium sp. CY350]MCY0977865.1 nuclear transport factor 2 family protein [Chryseobacterium sp. CY350]WBZ94953.1 nuclear transport factor 2 family protein [Chryseobacterium sp. CY350]